MWDRNDPVKHSLKELGSELSHRRATEGMAKERVRRPLRRETKMAVGMAIVLALAMVVAAINLFTHTFPPGTTGAHITTACTTLTMGTPSVPAGSGTVRFNCGATTPAFVADGSGPVTPTFSLGATLYTGLAIVPSAAIGTSCTGGATLTARAGLTPPAGEKRPPPGFTRRGGASGVHPN